MKKVNVYIDGFNVYHVLKNNIDHGKPQWEAELKWCDLKSLCSSYLKADEELGEIYFFTADSWNADTKLRGRGYQQALNESGITIIKGQYSFITKTFMNKMKVILFKLGLKVVGNEINYLPKILKYKTYEEKRTDVNIAVQIVEDAFLGKYDKAIIMSGDSDIVPAIESVKNNFPEKQFMTLWIIGTKGKLIKDKCDTHEVVGYKKMRAHMFPEKIPTSKGVTLEIPKEWK